MENKEKRPYEINVLRGIEDPTLLPFDYDFTFLDLPDEVDMDNVNGKPIEKRLYHVLSATGKRNFVVKIEYEDILQEEKLVGIKKTITWAFSPSYNADVWDVDNKKITGINKQLRADEVEKELRKRRDTIIAYLIAQAKQSEQVQEMFDKIFSTFKTEIEKWQQIGVATDLHAKLNSNTTMKPYLDLLTNDGKTTIREYLKLYMK